MIRFFRIARPYHFDRSLFAHEFCIKMICWLGKGSFERTRDTNNNDKAFVYFATLNVDDFTKVCFALIGQLHN